MITRKHLATALVLSVACATFAGAAVAGPPGGTPPGQQNATSAPGNSENTPAAANAAANAPAPQAQATAQGGGKSASAPGKTKPAGSKAAQPSKGKSASAPGKSNSKGSTRTRGASPSSTPAPQSSAGKITLCHKTGSASNPFVLITVSANAERAHRAHGDVAPTNGACPAGTPPAPNVNEHENGHDKVLICHRTSSETNPYVIINIARAGWENGHSGHDGDKLIRAAAPGEKPTAADLAFAAANCASSGDAGVSGVTRVAQGECPTTITTTERVLIGFRHKTGNGGFVFVPANANSAHNDHTKHPDDEAVYDEVQTTVVTGSGPCGEQNAQTTTAGTAQALPTQQQASQAGGVAGAQAALPQPAKEQPAGGVLGTIAEVGQTELPFTGLPLWIAVLIGVALAGAGIGVRKATR